MIDYIQLKICPVQINEDEYLTDVFKREKYELNAIPSNSILDKTLPGLGATYSEIEAKRNSIIIEPNVPVIKGKTERNNKLLAVYEGVADNKIKNYLLNKDVEYKKVLCTPESYLKICKIANKNNVNYISPQINRAVKNKSYFYNCYGKEEKFYIENQG